MDVLARIAVWLDAAANAAGEWLLAPVAVLPGWLSATLVAVATGLLMLVVFKYTSRQRSVKAVRSDIKANLLAMKLFKDSTAVTLRSQGRLFLGAVRLLVLAVVPMLVMVLPACLILGQLALWYQARPLAVGEDAVVTVQVNGRPELSEVRLQPTDAVEVTHGPVRVLSERLVCWEIRAREPGYHRLVFDVDGQAVVKELAVGDGFMRVSRQRPEWSLSAALENPAEEPFAPDSPIQAIEIDYPHRSSFTSGTNWWFVYWLGASLVAGLCCRRLVNVNI